MSRNPWPILVAGALATALLMALGVWQLQRLDQKLALIAKLDARIAADPVGITDVSNTADLEFLKLNLRGKFRNDSTPQRKLASLNGLPADEIIQPFETEEGRVILVNRGKVPSGQDLPPATETEVTGIIRLYEKGRGFFDPENNPAEKRWYWWDIPALYAAAGLKPTTPPLILQRVPEGADASLPIAEPPKAELRNNHAGYAVTWFGLATVAALMTLLLWRKNRSLLNP
jgi:surfeit locus 1 family protein